MNTDVFQMTKYHISQSKLRITKPFISHLLCEQKRPLFCESARWEGRTPFLKLGPSVLGTAMEKDEDWATGQTGSMKRN